jgi:hypothetical protein
MISPVARSISLLYSKQLALLCVYGCLDIVFFWSVPSSRKTSNDMAVSPPSAALISTLAFVPAGSGTSVTPLSGSSVSLFDPGKILIRLKTDVEMQSP